MLMHNLVIRVALAPALAVFVAASTARADIDLEWRPGAQAVEVGDTAEIGLYAVSDSNEDQLLAAMDVIIAWDPGFMRLIGVDDTGAPEWAFSGFLPDPFFINEVLPPEDGNGLYTAWGSFGKTVAATPEGTLITTFQFEALRETPLTELMILRQLRIPPNPEGRTAVYDGRVPGKEVTGKLGPPAGVTIGEGGCAGAEKMKKPRCKNKRGFNQLTVKLVGGVEGDAFTVELPGGKKKEGTINAKGKGKAKFKRLPPGEGKAIAKWGCGAEAEKKYSCP